MGVGVLGEGGRYVDDVAAAPLQHLADGTLRQPEEAGEVDADHGCVVVIRIVGERLGDVDAGVVDERVDAPEAPDGCGDDPGGGCGAAQASMRGEACAGPSGVG